jgi:hypothetical protein
VLATATHEQENTMNPLPSRPRRGRRAVAVAAAALLALAATACDPPPAPDGRDLGVTVDPLASPVIEEGAGVTLTGLITNHGSVAADGVSLSYAVDALVTVDQVDLGPGATCSVVSAAQITCTLAGPLAPAAAVPFTLEATAGTTSGPATHVVGVSSAGSEPATDTNPNVALVATQVRPPAADPTPLDVGRGTNYLGTGDLLGPLGVAGHPAEGSYLSVNPYCTDKVNGDRYQSGWSGGTCSGTVNDEFRSIGYHYAIDVPVGAPSSLDVLLWDARYDDAALPGGEPGIDSFRQAGDEAFTYSLYAADNTPHTYADNPQVCTASYGAAAPFGLTFLGSERWNKLCTITDPIPGRYLLRVRNGGAVTSPEADGSNQFGVAAVYAADGTDPTAALCSRADRPTCPVVSGLGEASIYVDMTGAMGRVPIGAPVADHEGRVLRVDLFDPGEGLNTLRLLAPSGPGTWTPVSFRWTSPGVSGSGSTASIVQLTSSRFNGRVLTLEVDLAGWEPAAPGPWLVEYTTAGGAVTDRTTWDVAVVDHVTP